MIHIKSKAKEKYVQVCEREYIYTVQSREQGYQGVYFLKNCLSLLGQEESSSLQDPGYIITYGHLFDHNWKEFLFFRHSQQKRLLKENIKPIGRTKKQQIDHSCHNRTFLSSGLFAIVRHYESSQFGIALLTVGQCMLKPLAPL